MRNVLASAGKGNAQLKVPAITPMKMKKTDSETSCKTVQPLRRGASQNKDWQTDSPVKTSSPVKSMLSRRSLLKPHQDIVSFGKISEAGDECQSNLSKYTKKGVDTKSRQSTRSKRSLIRGLAVSGDNYELKPE